MWEVKKFQDFCPRDMESRYLAAARRVKLWSLNANFFEEPHQLTKFTLQAYLNHIWLRTFPFKALIAIFRDLPSSLTNPDLLRFKCSSGHVLAKAKSVTPHFFYISDTTNSSSFNNQIFRKKSMLENFREYVLKLFVKVYFALHLICLFLPSLAIHPFLPSKPERRRKLEHNDFKDKAIKQN